jgi:hypothetical protein
MLLSSSTDTCASITKRRTNLPGLLHRAADANSRQIRSSSHCTSPPGLSSKIWVSALTFSTNIFCNSKKHCCSTLSASLLCLANIARILSLSIRVKGRRGSSVNAPVTTSANLIPSHLISGTVEDCSCASAMEPWRYVCMIAMPSRSQSKMPNTGGRWT